MSVTDAQLHLVPCGVRAPSQQTRPGKLTPLVVGMALACASMAVAAAPPNAVSQDAAAEEFAKGRLLVLPRAGLSAGDLEGVLRPHGGKARRVGQSDLHIVDLPPNASEKAVQALLKHHPKLKFAELDRRVSAAFVPNDPYLGSQWFSTKINALIAWDTTRGSGVTIAILDTGVSASHPDLAANLVPGWNVFNNNSDTSDVHGHGTAVAGSAAAASNNSAGVAGVAGAAKIMPIRIADANAYAYWSTVAEGLTWAADHGARVANISYVGVAGSAAVQSAAQYMKNKGGLVVVCAGNNGIDENMPFSTTMIPVSATDPSDLKTSWSSFGQFVAVSAPGINIWTTARSGGYEQWWGTSIASPVTAGVVALMMSANPALPSSQVESLLYSSAVDLGTPGRDPVYGYGRVNAAAAVSAALASTAVDAVPPSASITSPSVGNTVSGVVNVDASAADNVGIARVELRANNGLVATDSVAPFQFAWNSVGVANGNASLVVTAYDAAGNSRASSAVTVNVANAVVADVTPPVVAIANPQGGLVSGTVQVSLSASDNAGAAGIQQSLYIDGVLKASGAGAALSYAWNTRKVKVGSHTLRAEAKDAAGNSSSVTMQVSR